MNASKKKVMSKTAVLEALAKRVFAYNLLSRVFIEEANAEFLKTLIDNNLLESFPFQEKDATLPPALTEAGFYLKDPDILNEHNILMLGSDFLALYVGPEKMKAGPYESMYRSQKKLLFQEHTLQVRDSYAKEGFKSKNMQREPDDHMGLELEFMAKMSEKAYDATRTAKFSAAKRALKSMKSFLDEHILVWVDAYVDRSIKGADTDFYRGMAKVLRATVKLDAGLLEELLEAVNEQAKLRKAKTDT